MVEYCTQTFKAVDVRDSPTTTHEFCLWHENDDGSHSTLRCYTIPESGTLDVSLEKGRKHGWYPKGMLPDICREQPGCGDFIPCEDTPITLYWLKELGSSRCTSYGTWGGKTYICKNNATIPEDAIIRGFKVCLYSAGSVRLKIFRRNGTRWDFVGESELHSIGKGESDILPAEIKVLAGDYIGFYSTDGIRDTYIGSAESVYVDGDRSDSIDDSELTVHEFSNPNIKVFYEPESTQPPDAKIVSLDYSPSEPKQNDTVRIDYLLNNVGSAGKVAVWMKWFGRNEDGSLNGQEYKIVDEVITMGEGQLQRSAFFTMPDFDVDVMLTTESWDGNDWVNHHKKTVFINKREIKEVVLNDYSLYVCPEEGDCYSPANCTVTLGDCPTAIVKFNVTNPNSFSVNVVASAQVSTPSGFETVQKSATLKANETSDIWLFDVSLSDVGDYTITQTDVSVVI